MPLTLVIDDQSRRGRTGVVNREWSVLILICPYASCSGTSYLLHSSATQPNSHLICPYAVGGHNMNLCALLICSSSIISMSKYSWTHTTRVSHSFCWNAPLLPMQVPPPPQPPLPNNVDDDLPALFIPNVPYISSVCGRYELLNMSTTVFTNIARIANVVQVTLWLSVNYLNRCLCSHCSQCLLVYTSVY